MAGCSLSPLLELRALRAHIVPELTINSTRKVRLYYCIFVSFRCGEHILCICSVWGLDIFVPWFPSWCCGACFGLAHSLSSVSSAASAFDHTDLRIHTFCVLSLAFSWAMCCEDTAWFPLMFKLRCKVFFFLSFFDGGSIVYLRGRGVALIDLPSHPIACAQL